MSWHGLATDDGKTTTGHVCLKKNLNVQKVNHRVYKRFDFREGHVCFAKRVTFCWGQELRLEPINQWRGLGIAPSPASRPFSHQCVLARDFNDASTHCDSDQWRQWEPFNFRVLQSRGPEESRTDVFSAALLKACHCRFAHPEWSCSNPLRLQGFKMGTNSQPLWEK